jgi:hypothetical protein
VHFDLSSSSELPTASLISPTKAHAASLANSWDISVQALPLLVSLPDSENYSATRYVLLAVILATRPAGTGSGSIAGPVIPIYYAVAMALGGASALVFGKWFDRAGLPILIAVFFVSSFFAPLVFFGQSWVVLGGMILWGIGMGAQNSLLKSVIAPLLRRDVRATGFGLFDTGFGVAWFLGSWVMGILYEKSLLILVIFSVVLQLISLLVFALAKRAD